MSFRVYVGFRVQGFRGFGFRDISGLGIRVLGLRVWGATSDSGRCSKSHIHSSRKRGRLFGKLHKAKVNGFASAAAATSSKHSRFYPATFVQEP